MFKVLGESVSSLFGLDEVVIVYTQDVRLQKHLKMTYGINWAGAGKIVMDSRTIFLIKVRGTLSIAHIDELIERHKNVKVLSTFKNCESVQEKYPKSGQIEFVCY